MLSPMTPSSSLITNLRSELMRFAPFAQMEGPHVERFVADCTQRYFEPGEVVLAPSHGVVTQLLLIRRGSVSGRRGADEDRAAFELEAGDLFPIGAAMAERAVGTTYTAQADTFCLALPAASMHTLARDSAPFADFLHRRVQQLLDLSRRALQSAYASQSLAEQSLETPLGDLLRRAVVAVSPATPVAEALQAMHGKRIGSVLVADDDTGAALGILTRHDVLGRITLPGLSLATPIGTVMSRPLHSLGLAHTAQDAALLMSRHGIRHVPVADDAGRVVGILSERDLFALQRLSLKQVSSAIRAAADVPALQHVAADIRRFARNLLGQGVQARQLTELISHLNDVLTERLVTLVAGQHQIDLARVCWLAFGSEGRSEQTIATDQDNGIVFTSGEVSQMRVRLLAFARDVNEALDACGYPLCKGNVMASNPECCLTQGEWLARFASWIDHGAPEDLLNASIYFDARALAGAAALVTPMHELVSAQAGRNARFMKQMADNALRNGPALTWTGAIDTRTQGDQQVIDLKRHGTAIYVDAARLFALAQGIAATGTRARFEAAARAMDVPAQEAEAWTEGFEVLQTMRLQVQLGAASRQAVDASDGNPNLIDVGALNDIDRRVLKESLRVARRLQQRIEMDHAR
jgi:CBS domain-containing protein